jgi:hypothetical protein
MTWLQHRQAGARGAAGRLAGGMAAASPAPAAGKRCQMSYAAGATGGGVLGALLIRARGTCGSRQLPSWWAAELDCRAAGHHLAAAAAAPAWMYHTAIGSALGRPVAWLADHLGRPVAWLADHLGRPVAWLADRLGSRVWSPRAAVCTV